MYRYGVQDILYAIGAVIGIVLLYVFMTLAAIFIGALTVWIIQISPLGKLVIDGLNIFGIDVSGKIIELGALLGFCSLFFSAGTLGKKD